MASPVQVAVRARPLTLRESKPQTQLTVEMTPRSVRLFDPKGRYSAGGVGPVVQDNKEFSCDFCFWSVTKDAANYASQERVYSDIGPALLTGAFSGYNACVLAYGQTGAGKTYTMMGTKDDPGLIPRLCKALFEEIDRLQSPDVSYRTSVSFSEIYNEHIGDLLHQSSQKKVQHTLKVREHPVTGPYVPDLTSHSVTNYKQMLQLLHRGNAARATGSTQMNETSSRSHAVFTITFKKACFAGDNPCETNSHISLVDLAGSERSKDTGATGSRLKEGNQINKSLVALGNVISALADQSRSKNRRRTAAHIPYRDSTLTWLLKDSLGGNSLTVMIAAISPSYQSFGETLSTLRYASRAKDIVNRPVVNEDSNVKLIRELRTEVTRLRSVLKAMQIDLAEGVGSNSLAEQLRTLEKNETLVNHLTKQWAGQWDDYKQSNEEVAIKDEGVSVALNSDVPHLVSINNDITSTGVHLYHLREGTVHLTSNPTNDQDVALCSNNNEELECEITNSSRSVSIRPIHGQCSINSELITEETRLEQGQILLIGRQNIFRFNHPEEAAKLKRQKHDSVARQSSLDIASLLSPQRKKETPKLRRCKTTASGFASLHIDHMDDRTGDDFSTIECQPIDSVDDLHSRKQFPMATETPTGLHAAMPSDCSTPILHHSDMVAECSALRERSLSELSFEQAELVAECQPDQVTSEAQQLADLLLSTSFKQTELLGRLESRLSSSSANSACASPCTDKCRSPSLCHGASEGQSPTLSGREAAESEHSQGTDSPLTDLTGSPSDGLGRLSPVTFPTDTIPSCSDCVSLDGHEERQHAVDATEYCAPAPDQHSPSNAHSSGTPSDQGNCQAGNTLSGDSVLHPSQPPSTACPGRFVVPIAQHSSVLVPAGEVVEHTATASTVQSCAAHSG
eukprot:scpid44107/ scgid17662/ Kinesin-like protein KIF16B